MWFAVSKKKHQRAVDLHRSNVKWWVNRTNDLQDLIARQDDVITEQNKKLASSEREKVLADLESALHLIQDYQRSLSIVCAADPHYIKADALLDKYGLSGDFHKIVAGFQATPHKPSIIEIDHQGKTMGAVSKPAWTARVGTEQELKEQTQEDEKSFGDQSYGQEKATLVAERTDEGDRLFFVPRDEKNSPALAAAKATTEEAGFPEPDTLD
jgi:hypothetical protein